VTRVSSPSPFSLENRTALVTGANTGLGRALAIALARAGADIAAVGRTPPTATAESVTALGRRIEFIDADLREPNRAGAIVAEALRRFDGIDVLVNNAGIIRRNDALEFEETDWDDVMNVNLKTVFFLSQAVARHVVDRRRRGKIINVASMLSFQGGVRVASYTASKSGLAGLTKMLANEWAPRAINVNAIAPGYFATDNTTALRADEKRNAEILARIPAGRWGEPEDLAGAAVFLASAASDYVHGVILPVDGGWLAR
jgi:2-deoxy-D-gluconate 3-dehydrogenase